MNFVLMMLTWCTDDFKIWKEAVMASVSFSNGWSKRAFKKTYKNALHQNLHNMTWCTFSGTRCFMTCECQRKTSQSWWVVFNIRIRWCTDQFCRVMLGQIRLKKNAEPAESARVVDNHRRRPNWKTWRSTGQRLFSILFPRTYWFKQNYLPFNWKTLFW